MVDSIDLDTQEGGGHAPRNAAGEVIDVELNFHYGANFRDDYSIIDSQERQETHLGSVEENKSERHESMREQERQSWKDKQSWRETRWR